MKVPAFVPFFALVGLLAAAGPAAARPACGDAVIADWSDGQIDQVYAPECYARALDTLPEDVRAYSTAEDDINAALHARIRADAQRRRAAPQAPAAKRPADRSRRMSVRAPARAAEDDAAPVREIAGASPLPLPLLVGAAVALLLGIAGVVQIVRRHPPRRAVGQW